MLKELCVFFSMNLCQIIPTGRVLCNNEFNQGLIMEKVILFAGHAEQGILYVGQVLIEAALEAGWRAACISSDMQMDVMHCTVMISDQPIQQRHVAAPDIGVLLSLSAANYFERAVKSGGLLVMNASEIRRPLLRRDADVALVPTEQEEAGDPALAALTLLGALIALTGWMPVSQVMQVVRRTCVDEDACSAFQRGALFIEDMLVSASTEAV